MRFVRFRDLSSPVCIISVTRCNTSGTSTTMVHVVQPLHLWDLSGPGSQVAGLADVSFCLAQLATRLRWHFRGSWTLPTAILRLLTHAAALSEVGRPSGSTVPFLQLPTVRDAPNARTFRGDSDFASHAREVWNCNTRSVRPSKLLLPDSPLPLTLSYLPLLLPLSRAEFSIACGVAASDALVNRMLRPSSQTNFSVLSLPAGVTGENKKGKGKQKE